MSQQSQNTKRSGRSNKYSESKATNWVRFDPYESEKSTMPRRMKPAAVYRINNSEYCRIYERPIHKDFVRPYSSDDVMEVLAKIPQQFLVGLNSIYLMGGTQKQDKVSYSNKFLYGQYCWNDIFLFAFPKSRLSWIRNGPPKPSYLHEYRRAGAKIFQDGNDWICKFDEQSLKTFYMKDVLVHEIGHHVDRDNLWRSSGNGKSELKGERFAEWFAQHYGFKNV